MFTVLFLQDEKVQDSRRAFRAGRESDRKHRFREAKAYYIN